MSTAKKTAKHFSAPIAEVHLIPIELIDVREQIRTEFEQESIQNLADDIKERGLMQPVLLNPNNGRFTMIAGERRLRAIKLNEQTAIPALLTKASTEEAMLMQLAENIQREELSVEDECKAIDKLYTHLGSLKAVSARIKKSISWVSKRHSASKNMYWFAKDLIRDGVTEDFELLKALEQYHNIAGYEAARALQNMIRDKKAGRAEVRAMLKEAKTKKKEAEDKAKNKVSHAKTKPEKPWINWQLFVKHAINHEAIEIRTVSSKSKVEFMYEIEQYKKIGLSGEVWKDAEKVNEWSWSDAEDA